MMKISSASHSSQSLRHLFLLLSLTMILTGMGIFGGDFWWPDESRHAMDGVFFLDAFKDLPIFYHINTGNFIMQSIRRSSLPGILRCLQLWNQSFMPSLEFLNSVQNSR